MMWKFWQSRNPHMVKMDNEAALEKRVSAKKMEKKNVQKKEVQAVLLEKSGNVETSMGDNVGEIPLPVKTECEEQNSEGSAQTKEEDATALRDERVEQQLWEAGEAMAAVGDVTSAEAREPLLVALHQLMHAVVGQGEKEEELLKNNDEGSSITLALARAKRQRDVALLVHHWRELNGGPIKLQSCSEEGCRNNLASLRLDLHPVSLTSTVASTAAKPLDTFASACVSDTITKSSSASGNSYSAASSTLVSPVPSSSATTFRNRGACYVRIPNTSAYRLITPFTSSEGISQASADDTGTASSPDTTTCSGIKGTIDIPYSSRITKTPMDQDSGAPDSVDLAEVDVQTFMQTATGASVPRTGESTNVSSDGASHQSISLTHLRFPLSLKTKPRKYHVRPMILHQHSADASPDEQINASAISSAGSPSRRGGRARTRGRSSRGGRGRGVARGARRGIVRSHGRGRRGCPSFVIVPTASEVNTTTAHEQGDDLDGSQTALVLRGQLVQQRPLRQGTSLLVQPRSAIQKHLFRQQNSRNRQDSRSLERSFNHLGPFGLKGHCGLNDPREIQVLQDMQDSNVHQDPLDLNGHQSPHGQPTENHINNHECGTQGVLWPSGFQYPPNIGVSPNPQSPPSLESQNLQQSPSCLYFESHPPSGSCLRSSHGAQNSQSLRGRQVLGPSYQQSYRRPRAILRENVVILVGSHDRFCSLTGGRSCVLCGGTAVNVIPGAPRGPRDTILAGEYAVWLQYILDHPFGPAPQPPPVPVLSHFECLMSIERTLSPATSMNPSTNLGEYME